MMSTPDYCPSPGGGAGVASPSGATAGTSTTDGEEPEPPLEYEEPSEDEDTLLVCLITFLLRLGEGAEKCPLPKVQTLLQLLYTTTPLVEFLGVHASHSNKAYSWDAMRAIEILLGL